MFIYATSTAHIFISHAWKYNDDYHTIITWLNESGISYKNYSVPEHDPVDATNNTKLKEALTNQLLHANIVIIIGCMYGAYSEWIQYEVDEAVRMNKKIILIRPWGQERLPVLTQLSATRTIGWKKNSLTTAIRELL